MYVYSETLTEEDKKELQRQDYYTKEDAEKAVKCAEAVIDRVEASWMLEGSISVWCGGIWVIMRMPSLLGRDIVYRFRLVCYRNRNEVCLGR